MYNNYQTLTLICPKCHTPNAFDIDTFSEFSYCQCASCKKEFTIQLATIRSKRTKSNKKGNYSFHSIRLVTPSKEEKLTEFQSAYGLEPEMKSGDLVIFTYYKDVLFLIQNLTINNFTVIKDTRGLRGAAIFVAIIMCLILFKVVTCSPSRVVPNTPTPAAPLQQNIELNNIAPNNAAPIKNITSKKKKNTPTHYNTSGTREYFRGPRGGCFYYSASGKKVYVDRSVCN